MNSGETRRGLVDNRESNAGLRYLWTAFIVFVVFGFLIFALLFVANQHSRIEACESVNERFVAIRDTLVIVVPPEALDEDRDDYEVFLAELSPKPCPNLSTL